MRSRFYSATFKTTSLTLVLLKVALRLGLDLAKPLLSNVTLKQKVTLQQRLGFFILKNPSNANA
jgi:hypothetical protein